MKKSLFNHNLEVDIPDEFTENLHNERYPYTDGPDLILSNEERKTDITFSYYHKRLSDEYVKAGIKEVLLTLEGIGICSQISTYHYFEGSNLNGYWVFFTSAGIEEDSFNCMAIFPVAKRFMMASLSIPFDKRIEGKRIFRSMLGTLRDTSRELRR